MVDQWDGGKSLPGLKLCYTLSADEVPLTKIVWSPDGHELASVSRDRTVRLWNAKTGELYQTLSEHCARVIDIAWSPDGRILAIGSTDETIRLWETNIGTVLRVLAGHSKTIMSMAWSPDGHTLASASNAHTVLLWNVRTGEVCQTLEGPSGAVHSVTWSPDGRILATGSTDETICLWEVNTGRLLRVLAGPGQTASSMAWSPDGQSLAIGSGDRTIRLWDPTRGSLTNVLEGHTDHITGVSFSSDGHLLASQSADGILWLWRCDTFAPVARLDESASRIEWPAVAFHPKRPLLATLSDKGRAIRIWDLDVAAFLDTVPSSVVVHYANAKVILVGDSGVGKSALGLALTGQPFTATESTHGRRVWTLDDQQIDLGDRVKEIRETLVWDTAGQPGYRLIHQSHLDEVAVALVVFDAHSDTAPLAGVDHWARALRQAQLLQEQSAPLMKRFLVAARSDRAGVSVSPARIHSLMSQLGFDGYFETSAKEGWGIEPVAAAIRKAIDWESLPKVTSTALFQSIKSFLIDVKQAGRLLATIDVLYCEYLQSGQVPADYDELRAQFETCIGLAEGRGLIRRLSFDNWVLLQPELLDAYAAAMVLAAGDDPEGRGCIAEADAREGRFRMPEDERLRDKEQEKPLLVATIEDLLRHEIALRVPADGGPYLIFPSELTRDFPVASCPMGKQVVFTFEGPVVSVYTTLAVRLSRSNLYEKDQTWKNAATYRDEAGKVCGILLREADEGQGELTLFFDPAVNEVTRLHFEEFVHAHLQRRALPQSIRRRCIHMCGDCGTTVTDLQATRRRERGFDWIECNVCGKHVSLVDFSGSSVAVPSAAVQVMSRAAD
jgi:WD40 repeat protein